jgi:hypothetical protein
MRGIIHVDNGRAMRGWFAFGVFSRTMADFGDFSAE